MSADQALRAWMDRFIDYMTTKRGMGDALRSLIASGGDPFSQGRDRLTAAVTTLLHAGAVDRTLRHDVEPDDVLVGLSGVSLATADHNAASKPAACSTCSWTACASATERPSRRVVMSRVGTWCGHASSLR
jgi:hypothetical protein